MDNLSRITGQDKLFLHQPGQGSPCLVTGMARPSPAGWPRQPQASGLVLATLSRAGTWAARVQIPRGLLPSCSPSPASEHSHTHQDTSRGWVACPSARPPRAPPAGPAPACAVDSLTLVFVPFRSAWGNLAQCEGDVSIPVPRAVLLLVCPSGLAPTVPRLAQGTSSGPFASSWSPHQSLYHE